MNRILTFGQTSFKWPSLRIEPALVKALLMSQALAILWWLTAYFLSVKMNVPAWYDQRAAFLILPEQWLSPYQVLRFANPPWTVFALFPFHWLPVYVAILLQICLYFALLTLVIFKFGGGLAATLLALSSFVALDATIELNIDWLICLGLLVPPALSGPFLLIKPQDALGFWFTFSRRAFVRTIIVVLAVLLVSLLIWGFWPPQMIQAMQRLGTYGQYRFNLAPAAYLSYPISIGIGLFLAWRAVRRRDPVIEILAWLFFVPYIAFYSLLLHFAVFSIRFPRFALLISALIWIIYGGTVLLALIR